MSKAFTRESEDDPDLPVWTPRRAPLPPGVKNYITPEGARALRETLDQLTQVDRPAAAALKDPEEARRRLHLLDHRIRELDECLRSAVVVERGTEDPERVQFGAWVTVRNWRGEEMTYRIVGVDEADVDRGWVSWRSPIARAMLNARVGVRVKFRFPDGEEELEVVGIRFH